MGLSYANDRLDYSLLVSAFFAFLKVTGTVDMAWGWVIAPIALCLVINATVAVIVDKFGGYPKGFWGEGEDEEDAE